MRTQNQQTTCWKFQVIKLLVSSKALFRIVRYFFGFIRERCSQTKIASIICLVKYFSGGQMKNPFSYFYPKIYLFSLKNHSIQSYGGKIFKRGWEWFLSKYTPLHFYNLHSTLGELFSKSWSPSAESVWTWYSFPSHLRTLLPSRQVEVPGGNQKSHKFLDTFMLQGKKVPNLTLTARFRPNHAWKLSPPELAEPR